MSVTFYASTRTADGWGRPAGFDTEAAPNFAERNAGLLLDDLGFGSETMWEAEPIDVDLFERAVVLALAGLDGKPSQSLADDILAGRGRVMAVDCGLREGYWNERLGQLVELVKEARRTGATHIGWG